MTAAAPRVTVVGSVNHDVIVSVDRLPLAGETVLARSRTDGLGGKGANQAMAVARAGVEVKLVGAIGDDVPGRTLRSRLTAAGVEVSGLVSLPHARTGTAYVFVDARGHNQIVVDQGANADLVLDDDQLDVVRLADVLVVQCEVSAQVVSAAVTAADQAGTRVVVNLAPYRSAPEVVAVADPLVVNEHEAAELMGRPVSGADDVVRMRDAVLATCRSAIVTLGEAGAVLLTAGDTVIVPSPVAERVVDTTGAGDAFVGVLSAGLARGLPLRACAEAAAVAGSLSVATAGAGSGYPRFDLPGRGEV